MFGAINKYQRKLVAAMKSKDEFENRLIKATFDDMKEAKEKHVLFVIDVLKGRHHNMISPHKALEKILERLFTNLNIIPVIVKVLSILHRCLQDDQISQMIAVKIKEKDSMLISCMRD